MYIISLDLDHPAMKRGDLQVVFEEERQAKSQNNQGEN